MGLDAIETMLIERACERLVSEYCHLVDHGQASKVADLFTDDGFWSSPETTLNGRTEIERGFKRREQNRRRMSRHICSNVLIEVLGETTARGAVYLTLYRHDGEEGRPFSPIGPPAFIGEYQDEFEKTPEGWRFKRRETRGAFAQPRT